MILALDTATQTGWSLVDQGRIVDSGTFCLRNEKSDGYGKMFNKLWNFIMLKDHWANPVSEIAYEQAHFRSGPSTRIGVGCNTVVLMYCALHDIEPLSVHTASLKKWATGNGKASKDDMMDVARKHVPDLEDDNESDAIMVGLYAWEKRLAK